MIIACEKCKNRYNMDESITQKSAFRVRCSRCNHVFTVYKLPPAERPYILKDEVKSDSNNSGCNGIIAISNQKGGVAKTSTCLNLGISFSLLKKRVLLVDFDVQANLTISLGYKNTKSFYDVLHSNRNGLSGVIKKTKYPNLWLLPSNSKMAVLTKKYSNKNDFGYLLRDKLKLIKDRFDYILIDTPPCIEFFTLNALIASNFVIIPSQCEYLSTHGVNQIKKVIGLIRHKTDQNIDFKVLITMYDEENISSKVICTKLKRNYKEKTFNTVIGLDTKIQESQIVNTPVIYYDKNSISGLQYISLAKEFIRGSEKS
jgi:chromosome partitioning protein